MGPFADNWTQPVLLEIRYQLLDMWYCCLVPWFGRLSENDDKESGSWL